MCKKIEIIAFTDNGIKLGKRLENILIEQGYIANLALGKGEKKVSLSKWTKETFTSADSLVFIGATGIAVRAIAPYIKSKVSDPAVISVDDNGKFCIPLLSGHIGGANKLAKEIARYISAIPVITTATDINNVFAVDSWATENNLSIINPNKIKNVSAKLLSGEKVTLKSNFPINYPIPKGLEQTDKIVADIFITVNSNSSCDGLILVPKFVYVGIGCKKNTSEQVISEIFERALKDNNIYMEAVEGVYSIDLKAEEEGILNFCKKNNFIFKTYSADKLRAVEGDFTSSEFVKKITGVDNICERSAVLASGGKLILRKFALNGVTIALAIKNCDIDIK